ncbi:MAG TPA: hypothetical protein VKR83_21185, partial [Ktedonobacteraceae bacterium]|nr:hypothetical protein [Ktedonobacteraceae bacterium]
LARNPIYSHFPLFAQIRGTVLVTLPMATGAPPMCIDSAWVLLGRGGTIVPFQCLASLDTHDNWGLVVIALCWSSGFIALWLISVFHEFRMLWKLRLPLRGQTRSTVKRQTLIRHFARLVLLGSAGLALLQYTLSPVSVVFPVYGRYLTGLLIATPALIAPLWGLARDSTFQGERQEPAAMQVVLRRAILLLIGIVYLIGTIGIFFEIPSVQNVNRQQQALIHDLQGVNVTHFYTDYWTCDRLVFLTKEQLICAVLNDYMQKADNRVPGYYAIVKADPHSAYVFPEGSPQADTMAKRAALSAGSFRRFVFEGYVVYQPV